MRLSPEVSQVVARLTKEIHGVRHERKVFSLTLRSAVSLFGCDAGAIYAYQRSRDALDKAKAIGSGEPWDPDTVMRFFRNDKPLLEPTTIMAPVRSGGTVIGVMALWKSDGFEPGVGKTATEILRIVAAMLESRRHHAVLTAESAIAGALMAGVEAKNVAYRILHQVRRFIDYDHGATLTAKVDDTTGRVVARQVAWTKGRSAVVGMEVPVTWGDLPVGFSGIVTSSDLTPVWETLVAIREDASPPKRSILAASLGSRGDTIGCVEVSSRRTDFFLDKDTEILGRFLPYLSWCLRQLHANPGGQHE